jgi:dihydrofolate synthase/folylpolyglutamate synthase
VNYEEAVAALDMRTNYERTGRLVAPTLERIRALLDLMDNPQSGFPAIHITGTNGKTTCAVAASEVLRAAGLRVATYTSPHVTNVRERIAYDGEPISESDFVDVWRELSPYLDLFDDKGMTITWFEAATALAFTWFADKAVDAAVVEVGMGGSWDATNVIDAPVAALTRIDVDHPELGSTPPEVAKEKAGIIKRNAIAFSVVQDPAVDDVVRERARAVSAELRVEGERFALERVGTALGGTTMTIRLGDQRYPDLFIPMFGEQFARDATLGVAAAHALLGDRPLDPELLAAGLAKVRVPGRVEVVRRGPLVVLDGAHNPAGAAALATSLPSSFRWDRLWAIVSIMADKDVRGVLEPIVGLADHIIVTRNESPRASQADVLAAEVRALGKEPMIVPNVSDAISVAIERAEESDCILVTGSLYTVGEARRKLISAGRSQGES